MHTGIEASLKLKEKTFSQDLYDQNLKYLKINLRTSATVFKSFEKELLYINYN